jgi:putative hydrolase of the HAD superfamily
LANPVRGIIFDLGGTLMTFVGDWDEVQRQGAADMATFFASRRVMLDEARLVEVFLAERQAGFERAAQMHQEVSCAEALRVALQAVNAPSAAFGLIPHAVRTYFAPEEAAWHVFPDAPRVLRELAGTSRDGVTAPRLGVISNATDNPLIQRLVNRLELRPWLAPVWTSVALGQRKPQREPFLALAGRWELPPAGVIVVGDRLNADILGAHNAGMRGVLITADEAPDNDRYRDTIIPDAIIGEIGELPTLVGRL